MKSMDLNSKIHKLKFEYTNFNEISGFTVDFK